MSGRMFKGSFGVGELVLEENAHAVRLVAGKGSARVELEFGTEFLVLLAEWATAATAAKASDAVEVERGGSGVGPEQESDSCAQAETERLRIAVGGQAVDPRRAGACRLVDAGEEQIALHVGEALQHGRPCVFERPGGHDSPSVETPAAASTAAEEVEDTVGGRPDTAAGPSVDAVSGQSTRADGGSAPTWIDDTDGQGELIVRRMRGGQIELLAGNHSHCVRLLVPRAKVADAVADPSAAQGGPNDQRGAGPDEDRGRSFVGLPDRHQVAPLAKRASDVTDHALDGALVHSVGLVSVDDVEIRHDSPSVETRDGARIADSQVEDTVGGRSDTAAGPSAGAVSESESPFFTDGVMNSGTLPPSTDRSLGDWVLVDELHVAVKAFDRLTVDAIHSGDRGVSAASAALALAYWTQIEDLRSRLIAGDFLDGLRQVTDSLGERSDGLIGLPGGGVACGLTGVTRSASSLVDGGGHNSPSVETRAGVGSTDAQVEDTVGVRPDTAAGPPSDGAVSGTLIRIENFSAPAFEERVFALLEEIAGRSRAVSYRPGEIHLRGFRLRDGVTAEQLAAVWAPDPRPEPKPRERRSKDRHAGKPRRARD